MAVYIEGIKMPVLEGQSWDIRHGADGKWYVVDTNAETSDGEWHEIIPVPPHGRLIDEENICGKLRPLIENPYCYNRMQIISETLAYCLQIISDTPAIIEAEEGET